MAIAMALAGFNHLGRSVTPIFISRSRFYVQLSPHCPKMNKKSMWDIKSCHLAPARQVKLRSLNANSFFKVYMTDFFLIFSIKSPQCTAKYSKKNFAIAIFLPRVLMYPTRQISLWWATKARDQKQETRNGCDVISGLQAPRKTNFSDIFIFSYKQRTIVPFLRPLISSR